MNYTKAAEVRGQPDGVRRADPGSANSRILSARGGVSPRTVPTSCSSTDPGKLEQVQQLIAKLGLPLRQVLIGRGSSGLRHLRQIAGREAGAGGINPAGGVKMISIWQPLIHRSAAPTPTSAASDNFVNLPAVGQGYSRRLRGVDLQFRGEPLPDTGTAGQEADGKNKVVEPARVVAADQIKALIEQRARAALPGGHVQRRRRSPSRRANLKLRK